MEGHSVIMSVIETERRKEDPEVTVGEKITKSRDLGCPGRVSEARDDEKCQAWVIGCRWRLWEKRFSVFTERVIGRQPWLPHLKEKQNSGV